MLENPQTEEQMISEEGAEFKVGRTYYKTIKGKLYRSQLESETWEPAYHHNRSYYEGLRDFVDFRVKVKEDICNMKNELYASLELQISMAQDYSEWLKQETKRNNELLESHSSALSRLNELMVQSPSEDEKVDSGRGEELPDGLKWEDAPEWADKLAKYISIRGEDKYIWYSDDRYLYLGRSSSFPFYDVYHYKSPDNLKSISTRPEGV